VQNRVLYATFKVVCAKKVSQIGGTLAENSDECGDTNLFFITDIINEFEMEKMLPFKCSTNMQIV